MKSLSDNIHTTASQYPYKGSQRMRDIVADNPMLLPALARFGITLGFGDRTVDDVCDGAGINTDTFIAVINFISNRPYESRLLDARTLLDYLRSAHDYFLSYQLPGIRRQLIEAISTGATGDIALVILKFYDEYVDEVRRHMEYENERVFGYVEALLAGKSDDSFSIEEFKDDHRPIAAKLKEIKDILICHFSPERPRVDRLNALLFDIFICERDLITHCRVEDLLFIPAIRRLETHVATKSMRSATVRDNTLDANGDIVLTPRERDIIAAIARGKSNKEIADALCLSVHTVATHRRNICAKLDIHSASGMTLFAVLHGLVEIESV